MLAIEPQKVRHLVITESHAGQRLDNFLVTALPDLPKSRLYRIIRRGEVRVNKGRISVNHRLAVGDTVRIPPMYSTNSPKYSVQPSYSLMEILNEAISYEDNHLLIINKPAGLAVHG